MIWVLQLDHNGLPSLQFLRGGLVRFSQETNAEKIKSSNGHIGSFLGRDMQISAQNASVSAGYTCRVKHDYKQLMLAIKYFFKWWKFFRDFLRVHIVYFDCVHKDKHH